MCCNRTRRAEVESTKVAPAPRKGAMARVLGFMEAGWAEFRFDTMARRVLEPYIDENKLGYKLITIARRVA